MYLVLNVLSWLFLLELFAHLLEEYSQFDIPLLQFDFLLHPIPVLTHLYRILIFDIQLFNIFILQLDIRLTFPIYLYISIIFQSIKFIYLLFAGKDPSF